MTGGRGAKVLNLARPMLLPGLRAAPAHAAALAKHRFKRRAMVKPKDRASAILREFAFAEDELLGKGVVLTDGKAGTIERVVLDRLHGLRVQISGHDGAWPVSTIKFLES